MPATFREVLASPDDFPPSLVAQAKNLYEATLVYTGHAEKAVSGIVRDRFALLLTREEAGQAIGKILDLQEDVEKRAAEAFAIIGADFEVKPKTPPAPPPAPAPTPPVPEASAPTPATPVPPPAQPGMQVSEPVPPGSTTTSGPAPSAPPVTLDSIAQQIKDKLAGGNSTPPTEGGTTSAPPTATGTPSSNPVV